MRTIKWIDETFSICKLSSLEGIQTQKEFTFLSITDEEISLVCPTQNVPDNCESCDDGWKAFRIEGILDFSLIGILASISAILAEAKIGIFVVSTYNTDYVFVKEENIAEANKVLTKSELFSLYFS